MSEYNILALDDEIGIIDSLSVVLKRNGYGFEGVTSPYDAIERIKDGSYDMLILDYMMAPINGDKVVEKIREFNNDLYILMLTGHKDMAPPLETIKALDIQGYCEKTDKFDQLILLVESAIKSSFRKRPSCAIPSVSIRFWKRYRRSINSSRLETSLKGYLSG